ncbi:hypothetical protein HDV00_012163 [Rhizophlyctis rosea]|nr:hypothetical protein HDV00_012163 [Rhizophlyctis rosea]
MSTPTDDTSNHKNLNVILISSFVAFGGFLFGYDTGLISGILEMPAFKRDFALTTTTQSMVVSLLSVGTFIGALASGIWADRFGRKWGMVYACVVFAIGVAIQTGTPAQVGVLTFGRVVAGLGVGLLSDIVPLYHSEVAPKEIRGSLVATYQLTITIGLLLAFVANQVCQGIDSAAAYRIPIGLQLLWALILGGGTSMLPDSPRGLMRIGKREEAIQALRRLYGHAGDHDEVTERRVMSEIAEIQEGLDHELLIKTENTYSSLWRKPLSRRTWIGVLLQMFQQLTGVNFIFYYGTKFFSQAGLQGFQTQTITGVVNMLSTLPGMWMVDKWGRRRLMLIGCWIMFIGMVVIGIMGEVSPVQHDAEGNAIPPSSPTGGIVITIFACVFITGFGCSWGPGAWVIPSEIFPLPVRAKGISMATASNWLWNFILGFITPYLTDPGYGNLGTRIAFVWAILELCGGAYVYFFVLETRGLLLEEIDEMFEAGTSAKASVGWKSERRRGLEAGVGREESVQDEVEVSKIEKAHV